MAGHDIIYRLQKRGYNLKKVHIKSKIPVLFMKEEKSFIAYSPVIDLSSCGRTMLEAKNNFEEALEIFFEECQIELLVSWHRQDHPISSE